MSLRLETVTVDCARPQMMASFWSQALGYDLVERSDPGDRDDWALLRGPHLPTILFLKVTDNKTVKNRLHFDLVPDDQAAEVRRLKELGANEIDIGQGDRSWVVMADPEGNEFCVLGDRYPGADAGG